MNQTIRKRIEDIKNGIVPEGYKQTSFGIFPSDWETIALEEVSTSKGEYGLNAPACDRAEALPRYIRITDIDDNGNYIDTGARVEFVDSTKQYTLKSGDIVFARTGATVGRNYLYKEKDGELLYAGFLIRFSIDRKIANPYIVYANCNTKQYWNWIKKISARSGQPGVNAEEYGQYKFIAAKDKAEQGKIAEILMKWDEAVELQEQYIQKLEIRKKAIMKKLLTPKDGWKKQKLGQLCDIKTGNKNTQDSIFDGEYPFFVRSSVVERINTYAFDGEAILIPGDGNIGQIFHYINGKFDYHQRVYKISNAKNISLLYIFYYLQQHLRQRVMSLSAKATVDSLRLDMLTGMDIFYDESQIKICKALSKIDEEISLQKEKLAKIKEQRKAMQQYLLTGIVRIS